MKSDFGDFYRLFKSVARLNKISSSEKLILTIILSYTAEHKEKGNQGISSDLLHRQYLLQ
jgi:hypothetical protein